MRVIFDVFLSSLVANVVASPRYGGHESSNQHISTVELVVTSTEASETASPSISPNTSNPPSTTPSNGVSVPANCFKPNGVPVGWLPDGVNITLLQNKVAPGTTACTYGDYAQIRSTTDYGDDQIAGSASAAAEAGTVFTISLQPYIPFNQVNVQNIVASMEKILEAGNQVVWLRFAHEMNWYIDTNTQNTDTPYVGSTDDFKTLWKNVATAVDREKVKMFWSPNSPVPPDTVTSIGDSWFPGAEYVDIVGLDVYAQSTSTSFADAFGEFYDTYAAPNNLPLVLGETGWFDGGSDSEKMYWLGQVSSAQARERCPLYEGFSWFEYNKPSEGDFRVVMGSSDLASQVLG